MRSRVLVLTSLVGFGLSAAFGGFVLSGCGSSNASTVLGDAGASDGSPFMSDAGDAGETSDASADSSTPIGGGGPCPTGNVAGAIAVDGTCVAVTPIATGADPSGENATNANYAITPSGTLNGKLVLFTNGTSGHPSDSIADHTLNFYNAAATLGYQVLAVSYHSDETIASQCDCVDSCYFPSRATVIKGVFQTGAASDLMTIRVDESIAGRTALALRWLMVNDASHGWSKYLTSASASAPPETQIDWTKIVVAGHSQGGGHAAAEGKLFPVVRVIQLSSTCDTVVPPGDCSKTTGSISEATNATWLMRSDGTWQTPATGYWGLDAKAVFSGDTLSTWVSGDGNCFLHAQAWQDEGVPAAQANDDGGVCGATTILENHEASIDCDANFAAWQSMLR